jgi:hypothetical protein
VLPPFVEILKQLTSDEAKILRKIATGRVVPILHIQIYPTEDGQQTGGGWAVERNLSLVGRKDIRDHRSISFCILASKAAD